MVLLISKGSKEDLEQLRHHVKKGKGWAQEMLASRYREGVGVPQNDKRASELYKLAADQGHFRAQFNLAIIYAESHGEIQ